MIFLNGNIVEVEPPKNPKKITGTKLASVLGRNKYQTPFGAWVDMVFTYPSMTHKDTPQRLAGRILEPKIGAYLKKRYGLKIRSPGEAVGLEFPDRWSVDLFPQNTVFGGVWDYIGPDYIVEIKTTGNAKNWNIMDGKIKAVPTQYGLQGALYAHLCGFNKVVMCVTVLTPSDYPIQSGGTFQTYPTEQFQLSDQNTFILEFKVSDVFPDFENTYLRPAVDFWYQHIVTGISPAYDDAKDRKLLELIQRRQDAQI